MTSTPDWFHKIHVAALLPPSKQKLDTVFPHETVFHFTHELLNVENGIHAESIQEVLVSYIAGECTMAEMYWGFYGIVGAEHFKKAEASMLPLGIERTLDISVARWLGSNGTIYNDRKYTDEEVKQAEEAAKQCTNIRIKQGVDGRGILEILALVLRPQVIGLVQRIVNDRSDGESVLDVWERVRLRIGNTGLITAYGLLLARRTRGSEATAAPTAFPTSLHASQLNMPPPPARAAPNRLPNYQVAASASALARPAPAARKRKPPNATRTRHRVVARAQLPLSRLGLKTVSDAVQHSASLSSNVADQLLGQLPVLHNNVALLMKAKGSTLGDVQCEVESALKMLANASTRPGETDSTIGDWTPEIALQETRRFGYNPRGRENKTGYCYVKYHHEARRTGGTRDYHANIENTDAKCWVGSYLCAEAAAFAVCRYFHIREEGLAAAHPAKFPSCEAEPEAEPEASPAHDPLNFLAAAVNLAEREGSDHTDLNSEDEGEEGQNENEGEGEGGEGGGEDEGEGEGEDEDEGEGEGEGGEKRMRME